MVDQDPSIVSTTLMGRVLAGGRPRRLRPACVMLCRPRCRATVPMNSRPVTHTALVCGRSALSRDASDRCSIGLRQRSARLTIDVPAACPTMRRGWEQRSHRRPPDGANLDATKSRTSPSKRSCSSICGCQGCPRARLERHQTSVQISPPKYDGSGTRRRLASAPRRSELVVCASHSGSITQSLGGPPRAIERADRTSADRARVCQISERGWRCTLRSSRAITRAVRNCGIHM